MSTWEWALVLGMTVVTFGARYPVLALVSRVGLPPSLQKGLRYVPPAVLAAIITPAIFMPNGATIDVSLSNAYLFGGIAAGVTAWRSKNLLLTLAVGMGVFLVWRMLFQ